MERMLFEATMEGNVTSFLGLLQADPLILDRILVNCFSETPLHVASMLGHEYLVKEILSRKPELAQELNSQRFSPLHLASAKGYVRIVKDLLSVNSDMCLARDRDGRTPLHLAAIKGHVDVLKELVHARPQATRVTVDRGETILHLCVIHNQLEPLKLLIGTIEDFEFVNAKDNDGNTILHLAVADKQLETIEFLLPSIKSEVNAVNLNGLTAIDILLQSRRGVKDMDIVESLRAAGAFTSTNNIGFQSSSSHPQMQKQNQKQSLERSLQNQNLLENNRSSLIVVASLIATMAFQAGLTPPNLAQQVSAPPTNGPDSVPPSVDTSVDDQRFLLYNTIGFSASLSIILLLISGLPFKTRFLMWIPRMIMWIAVSAMFLTYVVISGVHVKPEGSNFVLLLQSAVVLLWIGLMVLLVLGHTIRLILKIIRFFMGRKITNNTF